MTRSFRIVFVLTLLGPLRAHADASITPSDPFRAPIAATAGPSPSLGPVYRPERTSFEESAGGDHWRFDTWNGPVHVWRPEGYDERTAGVVIYVHGYYTDVDTAWDEHALAAQFAEGVKNALYIVPEAPAGAAEEVKFGAPAILFAEVTKHTGVAVPSGGPMVVIGHSGAYRTLAVYLDYKPLAHVVLLDALYANEEDFKAWFERSTPKDKVQRKLTIVAKGTLRRSKRFLRVVRGAQPQVLKEVPAAPAGFTAKQKQARLLHVSSQYGHFELVSEGKTIPLLLQATALGKL